MLIDIILWLIIGALSGWIGFAATRVDESLKGIGINIMLGIIGSLVGGIITTSLLGPDAMIEAGTIGAFGAFVSSVLFIVVAAFANFFGKASSG